METARYIENWHTDTVKALMDKGAQIDLKNNVRYIRELKIRQLDMVSPYHLENLTRLVNGDLVLLRKICVLSTATTRW